MRMTSRVEPPPDQAAIRRGAFTLIELLVVMVIIAGLVALLVPTVGSSLQRAKAVRAATDVKSIEAAWKGYFQEYGKWPLDGSDRLLNQDAREDGVGGSGTDGMVCTEPVVALLSGSDLTVGPYDPDVDNPRRIQFMEFQASSWDEGTGAFVDPYGNPYKFMVDMNYDNRVNQAQFARYTGSGSTDEGIRKTVIAWSMGPDGRDAAEADRADDIRSWE